MKITHYKNHSNNLVACIEADREGEYQPPIFVTDWRLVPTVEEMLIEINGDRMRLSDAIDLSERLQEAIEIARREALKRSPGTPIKEAAPDALDEIFSDLKDALNKERDQ